MSATGTVKWFEPPKGQGVIQPDGGSGKILVDSSVVPPDVTMKPGIRIEFEFTASPKGLVATRVLPRG